MRLRRLAPLALATASLVLLACAVSSNGAYGDTDMTMIPQTTYLHLLKNTPFFTALTRPQLRWVIDHSHEWEVREGTVVASCAAGEPASDDFWILLDGAWRVEADGKQHAAGNANAGKWFSATLASGACQLVATEKSYVMKIARADMDAMLAQGFEFGSHLCAGKTYYQTLFGVDLACRSTFLTACAP